MGKEVRISTVDALFSNGSYPIEFLFLYERAINTKKLRTGLRSLSSIFWPAFGKYRDGTILFDGYREAECFDEEASDRELDISEFDQSPAEVISRFALPALERLFFLKAIRFRNGLVLIPKLNHLAGDGYSYFLLLSALAALTRPSLVPFKPSLLSLALRPHHRRTALRDFSFQGAAIEPAATPEKLRVKEEEIARPDVLALIQEAASSAGLRVSKNDMLSALAVKELVRTASASWGEEVRLTMPIDVRAKVKGYGRGFFGNGIMLHTVTFQREQVEASPAPAIAVRIRQSLPPLSRETYVDFLSRFEDILTQGKWDEFRPYDPERGCLVTNLARMPAEKLDFGAGAPKLSIPLTIEKNSAAILARGENFRLRLAW